MDSALATLAVLDGTVRIDGPAGPVDVSKKKTILFQLSDQAQPTVAKDVLPEPFDSWDKDAASLHAQSASLERALVRPYAYGVGDMQYYRKLRQPRRLRLACLGVPTSGRHRLGPVLQRRLGLDDVLQGAGYSWVSPYPWGWTPYHFGSWSYCPGAGWGWQPGGSWNGLNNVAFVPGGGSAVASGGGPARYPPRPVRPPGPGQPTLTVLNLKPLVHSEVSADSFVFRKDSAGLGIPREGLGKLNNKISQNTTSAAAPLDHRPSPTSSLHPPLTATGGPGPEGRPRGS